MAQGNDVIIRLIVQGEQDASRAIDRVKQRTESAGRAAKTIPAAASASLGSLAFGALASAAAFGELLSVMGALTGMRTSAAFIDIELQLKAITGSAKTAADIMKTVRAIGMASPFDVTEVAGFASQLITAGIAADDLGANLQAIVDIASFVNLPRENLWRFMYNLQQFRQAGSGQVFEPDIRQMRMMNIPLGKIYGAALGRPGMDSDEATKHIKSIGGRQAYDEFIRGSRILAAGTAAMIAFQSPTKLIANLFEQLNLIMEPTGRILWRIMGPLAFLTSQLFQILIAVNQWSGGIFGLIALAAIFAKAWVFVTTSVRGAIASLHQLSASIQALATSASASAGVSATAAGLSGATATGAAVAGGAGLRSILPRLWTGIKSAGSKMKIGGGLTALAAIPAIIAGNAIGGRWGGALSGAAQGAALGALLGSIIPGLGTGIGAAIGGIVGGIYGYATGGDSGGATERTQQKIAGTLSEIKVNLIGGGPRAQNAKTQYELEQRLRISADAGMI